MQMAVENREWMLYNETGKRREAIVRGYVEDRKEKNNKGKCRIQRREE